MIKQLLAAILLAASAALPAQAQSTKPDILEVIEVSGVIGDHNADQMKEVVEKINDNSKVKAVLLIVNSPGGSAVGSQMLYEELSKVKVPVVAWCNNVCASGGAMVTMAPSVKFVGIRDGSIAGSIGVIAGVTRYHRLLDWAKIDSETYKSGSLKAPTDPTRAPTDEERKYVQGIVDGLAVNFYAIVKKGRGDKIKDWDKVKTARIFFGQDAVDIGLADGVMDMEAAVAKAKELSGSKTIYTRVELKKMSTAADDRGGHSYSAPAIDPKAMGDLPWLIEALKEIHSGESTRFEYRMPYRF